MSHPEGPPAPPGGSDDAARLEARVGRAWFALLVAGVAQLLSFTLYSYHFWDPTPARFVNTYAVLCRDPFTHAPVDTPQARQRVLGPLVAYAVGLRGEGGQAVLVAAVFLFLAGFYLLARRRWPCEETVLLTLLMATTQTVTTSQTWLGYPDVLASAAVLACMAARRPWVFGPVLFLGMLGDERCVASAPLAALWHVAVRTDPRPARAFLARGAWAAAALGAWAGFYKWVQAEYVSGMPDYDNAEFLRAHLTGRMAVHGLTYLPGAAFEAFRTAWMFPALFFVGSAARGRRRFGAAVAAFTLLAAVPGLVVIDHSRCIALCCWPVVLIGAESVRRESPGGFRSLVYAAVTLNMVTPMYDVLTDGYFLRFPLPAALVYSG